MSPAADDALRERVKETLARQRALVAALLVQRAQLAGSLFARWAECGKESCVCRTGRKHGPYYVLSSRSRFSYLAPGTARQARRMVEAHQRFRRGLRQLRRLNTEIVGLLKRHQAAQSRRGLKRLSGRSAKKASV